MKNAVLLLVLVAVTTFTAQALDVGWSGSEADKSWDTDSNWWNGTANLAPTQSDRVLIRDGNWWPGTGPHVNSGVTALADSLEVGLTGRKDANGYLFIDGGQLDVTTTVKMAIQANDSTGTINLNSGVMNVGGNYYGGWYGAATTNIYGGSLNVGGWLVIGQFASSSGSVVNVNGGELGCSWLGGEGVLNLAGGTLVINQTADKRSGLQAMAAAGDIIAYNGDPNASFEYTFDGTKTTMTAVPEPTVLVMLGIGSLSLLIKRK
ncbi:hypothetical protein SMSP2_01848 [Limihaloglobus sulfuriphilus]|uniref:PEP-CTERM protein-sorting domain-containing protein n=1 Tax=Limihaloglobus sulfuriphilus TaxID=1851148 RepID=A0A1Q2MFQ0_9BACT|nr:PEP-CTERM sorting domain-containing protein [Limihaloglobus sulfuriphilus]AQQ71474.1 hypothetical protein SMSP2_01848 [Limihaloglobus sulfuriphilus]